MKGTRCYYVYVLANATRLLYIGVTNDISKRIWEHKNKLFRDSYTTHWHVSRLVYFERFVLIENAIAREKQLKRWRREKKIMLIEKENRNWHDLSEDWYKQA
ncbi:MAG: GIY-YIG nuclease family protein [Terriglobia bacterium]